MVKVPQFHILPLRCPNCSDDIGIGSMDKAFFCRRCLSLWDVEGGKLTRRRVQFTEARDPKTFYIPFWTYGLVADTPMGRIEDFHGYVRHIAFPRSIDFVENRPLTLFVMAASVKSEPHRLNLSKRFTYMQEPLPVSEAKSGRIWGPTISEASARNYAKIVFISTLSELRKNSVYFVSGLEIFLSEPTLSFIPFREEGAYYRESRTKISISGKLITEEPKRIRP